MKKDYRNYSYEQVIQEFREDVAKSIVAPFESKLDVAQRIYNKKYKDALHPSVLNEYGRISSKDSSTNRRS